jgi:hypothetical protein
MIAYKLYTYAVSSIHPLLAPGIIADFEWFDTVDMRLQGVKRITSSSILKGMEQLSENACVCLSCQMTTAQRGCVFCLVINRICPSIKAVAFLVAYVHSIILYNGYHCNNLSGTRTSQSVVVFNLNPKSPDRLVSQPHNNKSSSASTHVKLHTSHFTHHSTQLSHLTYQTPRKSPLLLALENMGLI